MCGNPNTRLLARLLIDFLLLLGLYCVALVVLPQQLATVQRGFHCSDATLRYPYVPPRLGKLQLTVVVVALPAAFMLVVEMLRAACVPAAAELRQRFVFVGVRIASFVSECYKIVGVYLFGLGLALLATRATKCLTGRLRPHFFDVCQPSWLDGGAEELSCALLTPGNDTGYVTHFSCDEFAAAPELLALVRHSFPSGFAAASSYAMCFLVFYAQARLFAPWLRLLRATLQLGCGAVALLVSYERLASHQNHVTDVVAGVGLGGGLAAFVCVCVAQLFRQVRVKRRQWPRNEQIYGYAGYFNRATYSY
ncbi:hypothetical protein KR093_007096 [Drosophila rubida]|uniref:Phosphatidic acid phosphatase type 2/haloperoxidase domain-containing protein n=1 Tax=Drosophila rubida TaxID=30044 RepID=A0AAD4PKS3_9MUSC|nr:hypothetical protein KR093_007096 [Drosophila rubida]